MAYMKFDKNKPLLFHALNQTIRSYQQSDATHYQRQHPAWERRHYRFENAFNQLSDENEYRKRVKAAKKS